MARSPGQPTTSTALLAGHRPAPAPVLLAPQPGDKFSFSKGINDHGAVAGDSDAADGTPHPAVWDAAGHITVYAGVYGPGTPATCS